MAYLLDADTFIQAKNLHYGFDFCPGFWDWIVRENTAGRVFSIEKVGDELEAGSDELADWTRARVALCSWRPTARPCPRWARSAPGSHRTATRQLP
jgi:hypothetical protein